MYSDWDQEFTVRNLITVMVVSDWTSCSESNIGVAKSEDRVSGQRDFGFNLCVVPFPNICVPSFKLENLLLELSELTRSWLEELEGLEVQIDWTSMLHKTVAI